MKTTAYFIVISAVALSLMLFASCISDDSTGPARKQDVVGASLCLSQGQWDAPAGGGVSPIIEVTNCGDTTSFAWTVSEVDNWLSLSTAGGTAPESLTIEAQANETGATRTGVVTVTAAGVSGSPKTVTVRQASEDTTHVETSAIIANHSCTHLSTIPQGAVESAKANLHIAYGHTSHGSQLVTGMTGLVGFKGNLYSFNGGGSGGALDLRDMPFSGANDLGNPNRSAWAAATRTYLDAHTDVNVVIWSWCGQVSTATEGDITLYLNLMSGLEADYPDVKFVYMTGHLDGSGLNGNLHIRNEQIRAYCTAHKKILYDFADIETYNPDGVYFGDKIPTDACDYDNNDDGSREANWAEEWQDAHPGEWYDCESAHSEPLNANQKAYAAWWLWARLAGWEGLD